MEKYRSSRATPLAGTFRTSLFTSEDPYFALGPLSEERVLTFGHVKSNGVWRSGGPFWLTRVQHTYSPETMETDFYSFGGYPIAHGAVRIGGPTDGALELSSILPRSQLQMMADGTTAIARTEPTAPAFDLSVAVGEITREGIPNIPGASVMERTRLAKKAGGEYLNTEFGWLPLVRSVRDFASTVANSDEILRAYQEGANKAIHRQYEWPEESNSHVRNCNFTEELGHGFFTGGGRSIQTSQKRWFEAEYIYHLPVGNTANDKFRRYGSYARKLLGVDLSPEVLWNLAPWSWAADWFTNCGDVMHNVSAMGQDGMVMKYGYTMCHTRTEISDSGTYQGLPGWGMTHTSITESKTRLGATPFGFGVSFGSLSAKQIAIVSALGLSRW